MIKKTKFLGRIFKILADPGSFPSARLLGQSLLEICEEKNDLVRIFITSKPQRITTPLFIRYGNSSKVSVKETDFNSPEFIRKVSFKKNFSEFLKEMGILSPLFSKGKPKDDDFPLLIRETLSSSGGKGIHLVNNRAEFEKVWKGHFWWTKFIPTEFELRLHILGGNIVKVFKKVREEGLEEEKFPIRNNNRGYHFSIRELDKYPKLQELIKPISEPLLNIGGKFYSLDVGWSKEQKKYCVFEANSASGLNEYTAHDYAEYIYQNLILK